jgi:cytochrome b subunit of formate dehydrogenase
MPAMTLLGWFHTIMGITAILLAVAALYRHGLIRAADREGAGYLVITVIVAGSALGIYNQGGFGVAHYLAVLTLVAAVGGFVLERFNLFGRFSPYFQAIAYSATILFHMIPAITDFLRRLPVGDPFIDSFDSPVLQGFHLAFLGLYVLGVGVQIFKLKRSANTL